MLPDGYRIRPLRSGDGAALAAAYRRNREHLAPWDPARAPEFWTEAGQAEDVARQVRAAEEGRMYVHLLWHGAEVVGRGFVGNIVRGHMQSAVAGYWIDVEHQGRGLATALTQHLAEVAAGLGLHRLEAGTMVENVGSQRVLERCGFRRIGVAERLLYVQGEWRDHVLYQRILHDRPPLDR